MTEDARIATNYCVWRHVTRFRSTVAAMADLNQLVTLAALLEEGSVAKAARRLQLSPSAMSRSLARLRETMGDPLLVRAGRGLVPTPRALELKERVGGLVDAAEAVLRPATRIDLRQLARTFTLRTSDGFVDAFGAELIGRVARDAPFVKLRFLPKLEKDSGPLRAGIVDVETGVVDGAASPEVRTVGLFRDRFVGVVRKGHALAEGRLTIGRYAGSQHVLVSRRGAEKGLIDQALASSGAERDIVAIVGGFASALALARHSDLVATVPEAHTAKLRDGMETFDLPFPAPTVTVSMMWHPRMEADPAHRWLRACIQECCAERNVP